MSAEVSEALCTESQFDLCRRLNLSKTTNNFRGSMTRDSYSLFHLTDTLAGRVGLPAGGVGGVEQGL